jgi:diguanylate cyclase (GGDEF)-like protein
MPDITKRLEKAEKYLQKGRMDAALEEYLGALQEDPANERVRDTAADLSISLGRNSEAAALLDAIFDQAASIGDNNKAVATYKKLARITTPAIERTHRYAQLIEKSSKHDSLEAYETVLQAFTAAGKKQEALAVLKRIVALDTSAENLRREGELAAELGDGKDAAAAFLQVGDLEQGAGGSGLAWYERAHSLDSANAAAALAYGRALLAQGDAEGAIKILVGFATASDSTVELREVYARALLAAKRLEEAIPFTWELFERDPKEVDEITAIIASMLDSEQFHKALELTRKLEEHELKAGRRREFVALIKDIEEKHRPGAEFLEYMAELFNATNREHDYCDVLLRLFELYYASGNFLKAADCLDSAAEVDAYEPGHQKRLEMLRGKVDATRFNSIASRLSGVLKVEEAKEETSQAAFNKEGTVLEDLMLQAEIFLQYSMRSKAVERLERIFKLFPREEDKNEKLRQLYLSAGFDLQSDASAAAPAPTAPAPAAPVPQAVADEAAVDNISRVTEITRNIYRQGSVKGVLFASVNDIGRHWNASRCVAGLCTPGKPPSAALEYCAPGVKQSDVMAIVKLVTTLQTMAVQRGAIAVANTIAVPELAALQNVISALDIQSLLAVPLTDGEEHVGILILEQCGAPRAWRQTDLVVLKTIADQMVLAVNNAKLRSLVKTLAVTDEKSGLLKRSSYLDVLLSEVKRSLQQNSTVSVMLMQFGKASALVREVGEQAVDATMQEMGQVICSHIRQNDVAVRYDLICIALILADTNDKNAFFVVDKLRKVLLGVRLPGRTQPLPITVGIAEAVMDQRFDPADIVTEVINRAEAALEAAKAEGGNKAQSLAATKETAAGA